MPLTGGYKTRTQAIIGFAQPTTNNGVTAMEVINGPKMQRRRGRTTDVNKNQIGNAPKKLFWEPVSDQQPFLEVYLETPL